jgi:hypothetical protein
MQALNTSSRSAAEVTPATAAAELLGGLLAAALDAPAAGGLAVGCPGAAPAAASPADTLLLRAVPAAAAAVITTVPSPAAGTPSAGPEPLGAVAGRPLLPAAADFADAAALTAGSLVLRLWLLPSAAALLGLLPGPAVSAAATLLLPASLPLAVSPCRSMLLSGGLLPAAVRPAAAAAAAPAAARPSTGLSAAPAAAAVLISLLTGVTSAPKPSGVLLSMLPAKPIMGVNMTGPLKPAPEAEESAGVCSRPCSGVCRAPGPADPVPAAPSCPAVPVEWEAASPLLSRGEAYSRMGDSTWGPKSPCTQGGETRGMRCDSGCAGALIASIGHGQAAVHLQIHCVQRPSATGWELWATSVQARAQLLSCCRATHRV